MYVRLFANILDSSIWLEPDYVLRLWITLLLSMDEDGFCAFACDENLARRANLKPYLLRKSLLILASPDPKSSDPAHDGIRIKRAQGGWLILNALKYRAIRKQGHLRDANRAKREARNSSPIGVDSLPLVANSLPLVAVETVSALPVNEFLPDVDVDVDVETFVAKKKATVDSRFVPFVADLDRYWKQLPGHANLPLPMDASAGSNLKKWLKANPHVDEPMWWRRLENMFASDDINPSWNIRDILSRIHRYADSPLNRYGKPMESLCN